MYACGGGVVGFIEQVYVLIFFHQMCQVNYQDNITAILYVKCTLGTCLDMEKKVCVTGLD